MLRIRSDLSCIGIRFSRTGALWPLNEYSTPASAASPINGAVCNGNFLFRDLKIILEFDNPRSITVDRSIAVETTLRDDVGCNFPTEWAKVCWIIKDCAFFR